MPEITTSLPDDEAYITLKKILLDNNCEIISEEVPKLISVIHGSLRGIKPLTAKKIVSFNLVSKKSETKIISSTQISKDWKNTTLYGTILAAIILGIFIWITVDMNNYIEFNNPGFWVWLVKIYGSTDSWGPRFMINVIQVLGIFLFFTIIFEIVIVVYVYPRKNAFSEEILRKI